MKTISDHEFFESGEGDLALLLDVISFDEADEPVFLVSKFEDKAYLYRSSKDIHEIVGINPQIIDRVRHAENIVVIELIGQKIVHSYDVPASILEKNH